MKNKPSWMSTLRRCLEQGSADQTLINHVDDILAWWLVQDLSHPSPEVKPLLIKLGEGGIKVSFEEFVDQLLIANPINYGRLFPSDLSSAHAKSRYRQLIRVFHPDRGAKGEAWLTYRAERVNSAYAVFAKREFADEPEKPVQMRTAASATNSLVKPSVGKSKRRVIPPISIRDIRIWLGSPERFQKKLVIWVIGLAVSFVLLLLLSALVA